MIKTLLVAGTAAGLVLAAGAASAGPCSTEIDTLQKQLSSTDAGMGPTGTGEVAETGTLHPPTDAMNEATEGKATSPGDVAAQNQGEPTDTEAAQAGEFGVRANLLDEQAVDILTKTKENPHVTLKCYCEGMNGNLILKSCVRP